MITCSWPNSWWMKYKIKKILTYFVQKMLRKQQDSMEEHWTEKYNKESCQLGI